MTDIEIRAVKPEVELVGGDFDLRRIWLAYRTCYSEERPQDLVRELWTDEKMLEFIERRMATEHTTPLEHATFQFAISGVSRVFTHQFVRHRVGFSVAQQSGRYTDPLEGGVFEFVMPPPPPDYNGDAEGWELYGRAFAQQALDAYRMASSVMPREDARFFLANAQATNVTLTLNFSALQHLCDVRLCTLAQWEFRKVVALMRAEVKRVAPVLAKHLGPKCMAGRRGACDEDHAKYRACPLSTVRPHRDADIMHGVLSSTVVGSVSQEAMESHLDREADL